MWYKKLFNSFYKGCDNVIPYLWMPNYVDADDASAAVAEDRCWAGKRGNQVLRLFLEKRRNVATKL